MATKKAPAKAASTKAASKAKAAPAPEIVVGSFVEFNGYPEGTPEEEQVLTAGEQYEVVNIEHQEADAETNTPATDILILAVPNPDFNSKKKVHPETNPEFIEGECYPEEATLVPDDGAAEGEQEAEQEAEEPAAEPTKTAAKGAAKATVTPIASGKGKAKTQAVPAPAPKGKAATKAAAPEPEVEEENDGLPDLEDEDQDILAIVNDPEIDIVAAAQEAESEIGQTEWKLGGLLFHIKKTGAYKELDAAFAENDGFKQFVETYYNFGYRKAMNLIEIYITFTSLKIENPGAELARIGWTKASKIVKPMREEGANVQDLIELAGSSTVAELSESISKTTVSTSSGERTSAKRVMLKFSFTEDEGNGIEDAILAVKAQQGFETISEALAFIVTEFQTMQGQEASAEAAPQQKAAAKAPAAKAAAKAPAAAPKARARA